MGGDPGPVCLDQVFEELIASFKRVGQLILFPQPMQYPALGGFAVPQRS